MKRILVTGGAGYIGSHTVRVLAATDIFTPVVYDNLSTGHRDSIPYNVKLITGDIQDIGLLKRVLEKYEIEGVIHFAASALVGESMTEPAKYYYNNVEGTLHLLLAMRETGVDHIVFSSTSTVYGEPEKTPIEEDFPTVPLNVYGRTKLMIESMVKDFAMAYGMDYVAFRYFNAAGASLDGTIGEDHDPESHLIPVVLKAAQGVRGHISVFGTDYPTRDGSCIRDYIHVLDLADAHVLAMQYLMDGGKSDVFNLGTEAGFSVREIVETAKKVTGINFKVVEEARRAGDPSVLIASNAKAKRILGWEPKHTNIENIIQSAWNWHKSHPCGYGD
jgi:UDP-glucose 4-epimerase